MSEFQLLYAERSPVAGVGDEHAVLGQRFGAERLTELYAFPDPVPDHGWVRGSMLSTVDGAVTGPDGRSASISGPPDRLVLAAVRHTADVVLVGSGTARAEGYRRIKQRDRFASWRGGLGQTPVPTLALVTVSGMVPDSVLEPGPEEIGEVLVLVAEATPAERVRDLRSRLGSEAVIAAGETAVEPKAAVAALVGRGLRRITCEGGPTWLAHLASAGCLDELCATTSPMLVGDRSLRILHSDHPFDVRLELGQLLLADGMLFARWLREPGRSDPELSSPTPEQA